MKFNHWTARAALLALMGATAAFGAVDPAAGNPVQVGTPAFGGAACPGASTVAKVLPSNDGISVVGEMKPSTTKASAKIGKTINTQSCDVTVPVEVAKGYQAALTGAKFEGSYDLPSGSRATLRTERFIAGGAGLKREQNLVAPANGLSGSYDSEMAPEEAVWTSCNGGGYNLRASTRMVLQNERARLASISIGRAGASKTEMAYKVQWRKCR